MKARTVSSREVGAILLLLWGSAGCGRPQHSPEPAATAPAAAQAEQETAEDNDEGLPALSPQEAAEPVPEAAADSKPRNNVFDGPAPKQKADAPGRAAAPRKKSPATLELPHDDGSLVAGLDEAREDFNSALELADCGKAEEFRDVLCELAERICELSKSGAALKRRCDDGQQRCQEAKQRYAKRCE